MNRGVTVKSGRSVEDRDAQNVLENVELELARKKAEIRRMARWLSAKKHALKREKKEIRRIRRMHKLIFAENRRMQKIVYDFLIAAEAENTDPVTEKATEEVIQGMNDLNLEGEDINITENQVQSCCSSGSAANGDNN
ncbi:hypothetical protein DITRI_Ditri20bG0051700 [Diplodiscus trichospermus]